MFRLALFLGLGLISLAGAVRYGLGTPISEDL
ncbi:MAG: cytochrome C, partial [Thermus sp.]